MRLRSAPVAAAGFLAGALASVQAFAQAVGAPQKWQMGFQEAATPVMQDITDFHNWLLVLITAITLFVLGLMVYIAYRFNAKANPVPSRNTHNMLLELAWTVVPIIILVSMAIPSFRLLYKEDVVPDAARVHEMYGITVATTINLKAIGHQWNWSYELPDQSAKFDAYCAVGPAEGGCLDQVATPGHPRLLDTTDHIKVPVNALVKVSVTATDVIHSWAVPAFGVKVDGVPGRINQTWFVATKTGTFYGQCSELCGQGHGFMPITVDVVSMQEFNAWVATKKAAIDTPRPPQQFAAQ